MDLREIPVSDLTLKPFHLWDWTWFLLTAGDFARGEFNTMTVAWGSLGMLWNKPFAQVVVRPTRHTFGFMERHETFTLCAFPSEHRKALKLLGTLSGRDGDKIAKAGLTPVASASVPAPTFAEADLILECRKTYWDDFDPRKFLDASIEGHYPARDYHRIYYGEILSLRGTEAYLGRS